MYGRFPYAGTTSGPYLIRADLTDAAVGYATLTGADLTDANLKDADLNLVDQAILNGR